MNTTATIDLLLQYEVVQPTHFWFHIEAAFHPSNHLTQERLTITPGVAIRNHVDTRLGNRFLRLDVLQGPLSLNYHAEVEICHPVLPLHLNETPITAVPDEVLRYVMPSRYCESDVMSHVAQKIFGGVAQGIGRVQAIEDWIHSSISYIPGTSNSLTTAQEVFIRRAGVCRDFAHLGVTFCRALNIPARLVVGYDHFKIPPDDFHAVFEAWLDGHWVMFDPTRMAPTSRMVRVGTGRDAKDVAFATIFGDVRMVGKELTIVEDEGMLNQPDEVRPEAIALLAA